MAEIEVCAKGAADQAWVRGLLRERWGEEVVVSRGRAHQAGELPALVAWQGDERVGLATYRVEAGECELVSLDSLLQRRGVGTALVAGVTEAARAAGCRRLWLITTNDNLNALRFYQKRGLVLVAVHCDALRVSRRIKPSIPLIGTDGIPLRDEIELELSLR